MLAASTALLAALAVAAPPAGGPLSFRVVARGLGPAVGAVAAPGEPGSLYVPRQDGLVLVVRGGRAVRSFLDLRGEVSYGGERGLLSLAFSPRYAWNRTFYVNFTDRRGDTRVVEYRSRDGRAVRDSARLLLHVGQPYPNHNGGQLQFDRDGRLYVGMGDGGSGGDPQGFGQRTTGRLSKLLRAYPDRRPLRWETVGFGLRNPWRFSFDRETGDLWIGDVGQNAWEEIDHRPASRIGQLANYGWAAYEGLEPFELERLSPRGALVPPVHAYPHGHGSCSVTGGYVYRGSDVPSARGRYVFGDYCSGTVWSLRLEGSSAADVRQEATTIPGLTSFGEDADGELLAVSSAGRLYRLAG